MDRHATVTLFVSFKTDKESCRFFSYHCSESDVEQIEKALKKLKAKKGYLVIEYRYLMHWDNEEIFTYEEIAEVLAGQQGYNNSNEKTV